MARRTSGVIDVTEILMHWHAGSRPPSVPVQGGATPPGSRCRSDLRLAGYSHAAIRTYKRSNCKK